MKIKFPLSQKEAELLHKALAIYIKDVRLEIARTDELNFRAGLQEEFEVLKSVEDRLSSYLYSGPEQQEQEEKKAG